MIVRLTRGSYAVPGGDAAVEAATALSGVLSHASAAHHLGWKVKTVPRVPHVTVPRHRRIAPYRRRGVHVHFAEVEADGLATTPLQTVIDCARHLPFDEALSVADSALRSGTVDPHELRAAADLSPGTGRARAIRVANAADRRADNPFESVVRAISLEFPALRLVPQLYVPGVGYPDLHDRARRLVVECDSFQFHSGREAVVKDVERYNACELGGFPLLRFAWEHAMLRQDYVRECFGSFLEHNEMAVGDDRPAHAA